MNGRITALNFSFQSRVISKVFRGKYMEELKNLWRPTGLSFMEPPKNTVTIMHSKELLDTCSSVEWIPYCKKTFHGAQSVIDYLGNIPIGLLLAIIASSVWMMKPSLFL